MKQPVKVHDCTCDETSDVIVTSFGNLKFQAGEKYYVHLYVTPDFKVDDMHCVVAGKFINTKGETIDKKIFVLKTDCKKYLIYKKQTS